jgi:hypothetical protein
MRGLRSLPSRLLPWLALAALSAAPAGAAAAGWSGAPGTTYAELAGYLVTGPRVRTSDGLTDTYEGPRATNANLRLYAETLVLPRLELALNVALVDFSSLGDTRFVRLGDPTLGARVVVVQRPAWALSVTGMATLPTTDGVFASTAPDADGEFVYARKGAGLTTLEPGTMLVLNTGRLWWTADAAYAVRLDAVDQVTVNGSLWRPLGGSGRWSTTVGVVSRLNLGAVEGAEPEGGHLSNGWGESAQNVGFYLRADYALGGGWSVGGGLDGGFWYEGYPAAPGWGVRVAYKGLPF